MANFKLTQTGEQIQADLNLLDSNSATQGQVLTANGTGGASWQNASGGSGGTQLYAHHISIFNVPGPSPSYNADFFIISLDSTPFTFSTFSNYCNSINVPIDGYYYITSSDSYFNTLFSKGVAGNKITISYINGKQLSFSNFDTNSQFTDNVAQI